MTGVFSVLNNVVDVGNVVVFVKVVLFDVDVVVILEVFVVEVDVVDVVFVVL